MSAVSRFISGVQLDSVGIVLCAWGGDQVISVTNRFIAHAVHDEADALLHVLKGAHIDAEPESIQQLRP
jgi:hypothetical protein